jgi:hypothetical protein
VKVENSYVTLPDLPGIGFEVRATSSKCAHWGLIASAEATPDRSLCCHQLVSCGAVGAPRNGQGDQCDIARSRSN